MNLRRWLRDVNRNGTARRALVSPAVQRRHRIPVTASLSDRAVTIRRRWQQIRCDKLAPRAFLLTSIDAITGEIVFEIDGPGKVNDESGRSLPGKHCGDDVLRRGGRKRVERGDDDWLGVVGLNFVSIHGNDAANDVNVGLAEFKLRIAVAVCRRWTNKSERRSPVNRGEVFAVGSR